jgi:predicted RNase H-like HicB family nuclease
MSRGTTPAPPLAVDVPVVLTAIIRPEPDAGGYSASIPALPGCHTQGETLDEVRANLREAAEGWLAVAHEDGLAREATAGPREGHLRQADVPRAGAARLDAGPHQG